MTSFYIYVHTKTTDNSIFYVGRGNGCRMTRTDSRNKHWKNIVAKHGFFAEIIEDNLSSEQANEREIFWIKKFKDEGHQLANITVGGAGTSGWKRPKEQCERISQSLTGKKWDDARKKAWAGNTNALGCSRTDEQKEFVSNLHKNKPKSEEHRRKLSESLKGRKLTEDQIELRRKQMKERWAAKKALAVAQNT